MAFSGSFAALMRKTLPRERAVKSSSTAPDPLPTATSGRANYQLPRTRIYIHIYISLQKSAKSSKLWRQLNTVLVN